MRECQFNGAKLLTKYLNYRENYVEANLISFQIPNSTCLKRTAAEEANRGEAFERYTLN